MNIPSWKLVDNHSSQTQIGGCTIPLFGLAYQHPSGEVVTGSAMEEEKAHYELWERVAIYEALPKESYSCFDYQKNFLYYKKKEDIFPASNNENYRYSYSNGVAYHKDWSTALHSAQLEVIERDLFLRYWYSMTPPLQMRENQVIQNLKDQLQNHYLLKAYTFPMKGSPHVVAIFAFPTQDSQSRFVIGLGCGKQLDEALQKAIKETLQRIGFLYGEEYSDEFLFHPDPLFHQDYYLYPSHYQLIREWIMGRREKNDLPYINPETMSEEWIFIDLTPPWMKEGCVVKALSNQRVPLIFGKNYLYMGRSIPENLSIHPIA